MKTGVPLYVKCSGRPDFPYLSTQNKSGSRTVDLWSEVDSQRQVWRLDEAPNGTYTIRVMDGGAHSFLSVQAGNSCTVDLYTKDDASGRQRFFLKDVGNGEYNISVSGGRDSGANMLLSAWAAGETNAARDIVLFSHDDGSMRQRFSFEEAPVPKTDVPPGAVSLLYSTAGLSEEQIDTIQRLVACPENSTTEWVSAYGFAKRLKDGRGITFGIVGFCSGTGDGVLVLDELVKRDPSHRLAKYIPAMRKTKGDDCSGLDGFESDAKKSAGDVAYREAQWAISVKQYWAFAADYCGKKGRAASRPGPVFSNALSVGAFFDVALNHGAEPSSFKYITDKMKNAKTTDEATWLSDFLDSRKKILKSGYQSLDTSGTGDRCAIWKKLVDERNWNLARPITVAEGYWSRGGKPFKIT